MSSVAARRSTYIPPHPSLTGPRTVRRLPLMNWQWISFGEVETSAAAAGQNEFSLRVRLTGPWRSTITAASSSRDLWPRPPTSRSTSLQAGPACRRSRRPSESQPVIEAMMPADLLLNRPCPLAGSYCQVHDQTSVEAFLLLLNIHNPHHHHQHPYIVI